MKSNNTLFSVIVPAYNAAFFIHTCIDSILGQTCPDFELILVDDGSTDDTLRICNAYAESDPRVKVIHKENGGHTSARNEGLKNSTGDYVLFVDSDDWLSKQALDICRRDIADNDPDIVVYRMQNSDSDMPYSVLLADGCYDIEELECDENNSFVLSKDGNFLFPKSLSAKCFKREVVYESQMGVPKEISLGEDGAAFIGAMLRAQKVSVIARNANVCYYCLIRPDSVSRSADAGAFEKATVLLLYYENLLKDARIDYAPQFERDVVAQLYTATLLVIRSGGKSAQLNKGLNDALKEPVIARALKRAKFSMKGYKFIIKKLILRYRLWGLAVLLDR